MTVPPNTLTVRPLTGPEELELFSGFSYALDHEFPVDMAEGRRLPQWMWVAMQGDRLVARLSWWRRDQDDRPLLLDVLDVVDAADVDRVAVAEHLVRTAAATVLDEGSPWPEYLRFLPAGWREDPDQRAMVRDLMTALENTGAHLLTERLRFTWRDGSLEPRPRGRLRFREIEDTADILDLMTRALEGTLDTHDNVDLREKSAREVAEANFADEFAAYSTPRAWWRVATSAEGEPVGFVIPARNAYHPIIAYIAVLPEHRGHGYIDDLLAEGGRVLREAGVDHINSATDLGNQPMARAFQRAGYDVESGVITMVWDHAYGPEAGGAQAGGAQARPD
ncbi:GNAT family N-acetyltransferase [Nocardiopsis sp. MG754419]|uniref:GNAT family N-acetyltransferase n=1 Tax=Nocardiopsis sp. MG754419 TaxID=2259865 RepID=UPI001BAAD157|nr:GNAT family N-acetyltransferase [Nocardiopsis sp. MG754419]MBR8745405.1 GNAT family N-acetyltransferase [Nocardiopsis sp. MG754419]